MNLLKLAKIIKQIYKVAGILETSLNSLVSIDESAGSHLDEKLKDIIRKAISGIQAIRSSIEKVAGFIGIELDEVGAKLQEDLDAEIAKLKEID